jgi:hypothetical protein
MDERNQYRIKKKEIDNELIESDSPVSNMTCRYFRLIWLLVHTIHRRIVQKMNILERKDAQMPQ